MAEVKPTETADITSEMPPQPVSEEPAYREDDEPQPDHQPVSATKRIITVGELLPDGAALEPLRGGQLVLISRERSVTGTLIEHAGVTYQALPLAAELEKVLRLPRRVDPHASVESLFADLTSLAETRAGLEPAPARLWTAAVLASHLVGAIPVPVMNLWGGPGTVNTAAVQLTTALVRRPLPLAELNWGELLRLPAGLVPTVITALPNTAWLRRLLTAASAPGFVSLQGGAVVNFRCSLVVCSHQQVAVPALPIAAGAVTHALAPISPAELDGLAEFWQPRLLDYRARCWTEAAQYAEPLPELSALLQPLSRSLLAALAGSVSVQEQLRTDLAAVDESYRSERSEGTFGAVVEALLALVVARAPHVYVHEVTRLANESLTGRQEKAGLTPQVVGAILREQVGLTPKRMTAGYRVPLDESAAARIKSLAEELGMVDHAPTGPPAAGAGATVLEPAAACSVNAVSLAIAGDGEEQGA